MMKAIKRMVLLACMYYTTGRLFMVYIKQDKMKCKAAKYNKQMNHLEKAYDYLAKKEPINKNV